MLVETPYQGKKSAVKLTTAPSGAGTDKSGKHILFDKHLPLKINGIDTIKSTAHHESEERRLLDEGLKYPAAHKKAERYEDKKLHEAGYSTKQIESYQEKINNAIRKLNDKYDPNIDPRVKNAKAN